MPNTNPYDVQLTDEQERALTSITEQIQEEGEPMVSLQGYAGSGKTTLLRFIIRRLRNDFQDVFLAAPTHKAAEVLRNKTNRDVRTVHSLFAMKPVWDGKGGYKFVPSNDQPERFVGKSLLVIDEASMVPQEIYDEIEKAVKKRPLTVVFCGDPAQLPPVNESRSPALFQPGDKLQEIVRQERGNPIIGLSMEIRESQGSSKTNVDSDLWDRVQTETNQGKGIHRVSSREALLTQAVSEFETERCQKHPSHARMIAYRNKTVDTYNDLARQLVYEDRAEEDFIEGEWLVANDPWYRNSEDLRPVIQNSEEVVVLDKEPAELLGFDSWILEIAANTDGDNIRYIETLQKSEEDRFASKLEFLKDRALNKGGNWKKYYHYKEAFCNCSYNFAVTAHKSQGSTFEKVFVDVNDLLSCPNPEEVYRLLYVAVTRASSDLFVYQK